MTKELGISWNELDGEIKWTETLVKDYYKHNQVPVISHSDLHLGKRWTNLLCEYSKLLTMSFTSF